MSEKCEKDWKKTLDAPLFLKGIDEELSDLVVKFLSQDYADVATNPSKQKEIQRMVDKFASVLGVRISRTLIFSDPNSTVLGGYVDKDKSIALNATPENLGSINKMTFLNTIVHELRHAQQHQIFSHLSDSPEFASLIDENFKHYQRPAGKIVQNARYFSNFIEVDAELFSYAFSEGLLEQIKSNPKYAAYGSQISNAHHQNQSNKADFKHNFDASIQVLELNNKAYLTLKQALEEFKKAVFSENPPSQSEIENMSQAIITMANALINDQASQLIDFDRIKVHGLLNALYSGADPIIIAKHLDNPVVCLIDQLDNKYCFGLGDYSRTKSNLTSLVEKCSIFLTKYKIPFNKNNPSEILEKAKKVMPEIYLMNVKKHDESDDLKSDMNLLYTMDCRLKKKKFNELFDECVAHVVASLPKQELQSLLEELSEIDDKHLGYCRLRDTALNGYANKFAHEKTWHTIENFLQLAGVHYKKGDFPDMVERYDEALPKFIVKCMLKGKLTPEETSFMTSFGLGSYGNVEPQALVEALQSTFMSKARLEKALKNPSEKNAVIEALEKRGINVQELLTALSKSKNNS